MGVVLESNLFDSGFPSLAFALVGLIIIASTKPGIGLLFFLGSLYLESALFSIETPMGRLRPNLLMVVVVAIAMTLNRLFMRRPVVIPRPIVYLGIYVAANAVLLFKSQDITMSVRIVGLLVAWVLVNLYLVDHCSAEKVAVKLVKAFLLFGLVQALIGAGQILGEFERPTGLVGDGDSDYFALAMMGNLLILNTLSLLRVRVFGKIPDYAVSSLFAVNVLLSFVRSSWIGYFTGLFALGFFIVSLKSVRFSMRGRNLLVTIGLAATACIAGWWALPDLRDYFWERISLSETGVNSIMENSRLVMMEESWNNALDSPLLGHGPGAFVTQGSILNIDYTRGIPFDPSIATTLMNDTGMVGTALFIFYLVAFFRHVIASFKTNPESIPAKYAIAFSVAVIGLLFCYVATNGLWLPFSWVFFGIATACANCAFVKRKVAGNAGI